MISLNWFLFVIFDSKQYLEPSKYLCLSDHHRIIVIITGDGRQVFSSVCTACAVMYIVKYFTSKRIVYTYS